MNASGDVPLDALQWLVVLRHAPAGSRIVSLHTGADRASEVAAMLARSRSLDVVHISRGSCAAALQAELDQVLAGLRGHSRIRLPPREAMPQWDLIVNEPMQMRHRSDTCSPLFTGQAPAPMPPPGAMELQHLRELGPTSPRHLAQALFVHRMATSSELLAADDVRQIAHECCDRARLFSEVADAAFAPASTRTGPDERTRLRRQAP